MPRHRRGMVADDAEMLAHLCGHMQHSLQRPDHRNVDRRTSTLNADVEHAERHHRVVAFTFGLAEGLMKDRRGSLDLRRREAVEWPRRYRKNPDLHIRRRVALGDVL